MDSKELKMINPVAILLESDRITKSDISSLSTLIVEKIFEEGTGEREIVVFEALSKLCDEVKSELRGKIDIKEVFTIKGVKIEPASVARTFDYSVDPVVMQLEAKLKARKELLKTQYNILNNPDNMGKDIPGIVDEGGEVLPLISVKSGGGTTIKLTIPKN